MTAEHVQAGAAQSDGLEEVAGKQGVGLGAEETGPGGEGALRRRADPGQLKDLPHGGGRDPDPEHEQFAVNAPVAPAREMLSSTFQRLGIPADPRRAAQTRPPGRRVHDPPGPQGPEDPPARNGAPTRPPGSPGALLHRGPSGPRMPLIAARGPSKPLGRFRSSAAARCFPPAGTDVSSGGRWRVRGVSGCCVRRWACRGGPGSPP